MTFCYLLKTSFCYSQLCIFINKVCHQEAMNWWWPVIATVKDTTRPTSAQSWVELLLSGKELHLTACWQTMILSYSTLLTPHLKGSAIMEQWLDVLSMLITTFIIWLLFYEQSDWSIGGQYSPVLHGWLLHGYWSSWIQRKSCQFLLSLIAS